jgi:hypothetical protein
MPEFQKVNQIGSQYGAAERWEAAMTRYRPADDKHFFAYHFLQRLPCEPVDNMQAVAEKADSFMVLHKPQQHDVAVHVAATADEAGKDLQRSCCQESFWEEGSC